MWFLRRDLAAFMRDRIIIQGNVQSHSPNRSWQNCLSSWSIFSSGAVPPVVRLRSASAWRTLQTSVCVCLANHPDFGLSQSMVWTWPKPSVRRRSAKLRSRDSQAAESAVLQSVSAWTCPPLMDSDTVLFTKKYFFCIYFHFFLWPPLFYSGIITV